MDVPDVLDLTAPQTRVLGCLLEKQVTTPDVYPLTLKALTTACNQTSNREPVVAYDPQLVETTVLALKGKGLARVVHPASGERATKFRQVADEALGMGPAERALVCVLLLRGAQTVAELTTRTERLHPFGSSAEVESTLRRLAERERPLVRRVEPRAGQKEARWVQLLEANAAQRIESAGARPAGARPDGAERSTQSGRAGARDAHLDALEARVETLERRVAQLVEALGDLVDLPDDAELGPTDTEADPRTGPTVG